MEKILIIEDSKVVQAQLIDILAGRYEIACSDNGVLGIEAATGNPPDLILLDIRLPKMDGYQVCQLLKSYETTMQIPIIFITAMDAADEKVRGFEAGAADYIVKPFYPAELLARVEVHLASRRVGEQALELERLNLFKEMAVALSHEINNPLTAAYGYLHLLDRDIGGGGDQSKERLAALHTELERIREIVGKLAQASRVARTSYSRDTLMIDLTKI